MPRPASKHPTAAELQILKVLWRRGPGTVRQVQEGLAEMDNRPRAYTSVMTLLSIMHRKRYLTRKKATDGGYVYSPRLGEHAAGRGMLRDLVDRVFSGSTLSAALHLIDARELNEAELRELRKKVDEQLKKGGEQ